MKSGGRKGCRVLHNTRGAGLVKALVEALEPRQMLTRVVGYLPEYRYSRFADIDLSAVTHINYFSIAGNADGTLSTANVNLSHLGTVVSSAHSQGKTVSITLDWATPFMTIVANSTALAN